MRLMLLGGRNSFCQPWITTLQSCGFDLDRFHYLAEADEVLRQAYVHYAMLLIDRELPDGDGVEWLRSRRRRGLQIPFVVVTQEDDLECRIRALEAGADDAVTEALDARELAARLRALLRRQPVLQPDVLKAGNVHIDITCRQLSIAGQAVKIPRRELGILEMLVRAFTRTLTREFLEQNVYGAGAEVSPNSIEVRMSRLRRLLSRHGADVEIETIRGVGYQLRIHDTVEAFSHWQLAAQRSR
jgi:two-component system OmpR family response regulator